MKSISLSYKQIVQLELISEKLGKSPVKIEEIEDLLGKKDVITSEELQNALESNEIPEQVNAIINSYPDELSDSEKIKYARDSYIQLGMRFSYDESFYVLDDEKDKTSILNRRIKDITEDKAICRSISKMYLYALEKKGINAKIVIEELDNNKYGHAYVEFELNGIKFRTDLTRDLANIKKGFKTQFFEIENKDNKKDLEDLDQQLKAIYDEIGYTYNRKIYG